MIHVGPFQLEIFHDSVICRFNIGGTCPLMDYKSSGENFSHTVTAASIYTYIRKCSFSVSWSGSGSISENFKTYGLLICSLMHLVFHVSTDGDDCW